MAFENIAKAGNYQQTASGDYGFKYIQSGGSETNSFRVIQVLQDATITTTTTVGDALTSVTLSEGTVIYGKFDSVAVSSGAVLAYLAS